MDTITPRREVFRVVDGERDYQDTLALTSETDGHHTVTEFLLYMDAYMNDAKQVASKTWGLQATVKSLDLVRKITALGVACMEQNGVVERRFQIRRNGALEGLTVGQDISLAEARELVEEGAAEVVR